MVNMEGGIDANEPLDYIEFQIFPTRSRYEASIFLGKNSEVAAYGSLEPLLLHSPQIKALHSKGSDNRFKLAAPEDGNGARWFIKSTLLRFLQIVSSSEVLKDTTALRSEISQLEEAHSFQLSLYGKGSQKHFAREDADLINHESETNGFPKDGTDAVTSDDSKNELLRAMHLRLATLRVELSNAFAKAATMTFSKEEINDIAKFCSLIGATDLRKSFCYLVELSEEKGAEINMRSGIICEAEDTNQISKQSNLPVQYGCSPAKVAEVERQNSSESGESSDSSMEEQPSMERSRTLIRSASPRRSASPMRRVQIGKSGSRRSTPLTIKSLSYFPRERSVFQNDEGGQDTAEEAQQPSKKSESNTARSISVQDAISLFESKRRDETSGIQKTNSFSTASVGPNKSVLRRWSTGIGGASNACQDSGSDSSVELPPSNARTVDSRESSPEGKPEHSPSIGHVVEPTKHDPSSIDHEPAQVDAKPDCPQQSESNLGLPAENDTTSQSLCIKEKKTASTEWSRQKEAELDQLLMKMMETKPVKYKSASHLNDKSNEVLGEKKGGLFERNKQKKNEKFQNKNARKVADKEKQLRSIQLVPDKRNSEMGPRKTNHGGNKHNMDAQKSKKTTSSSSDSSKDILKSSVSRKASSKTPLPATRKSWPSAPTTRSTGISPAKTAPEMASAATTTRRKSQPAPPSVTGSSPKMLTSPVLASAGTTTTTTRRKSQPASSVTGSIPKRLTSPQPKTNNLKAVQNDKNKTTNDVNAKNQQPLKKNPTSTKSKTQNVDADSTPSGKPSLYSKVTKKSSVVPLEPKAFLRKGSKVGAAVSSISMTKGFSEADESSKDSKDQILPGGNEIVSASSDVVISQQEVDLEPLKDHVVSEQDVESRSLDNSLDTISQVALVEDDIFQEVAAVSSSFEALDKPTISLTAWVDIDEHEDQAVNDNICQVESSPNITPTSIPSPRVRYSLSQMLLEETSEPDINEWGNADNPPTMVCQKDAPKGLKKLLKFARKSKTDANSTGWSSPSVFSEGEDDAEESRSLGKRSSENLLKMATLQAKNYGNQKASFQEKTSSTHGLFGRSNINKATPQSISGDVQDSRNSGLNSQAKATRPFFSLSAFRGSK